MLDVNMKINKIDNTSFISEVESSKKQQVENQTEQSTFSANSATSLPVKTLTSRLKNDFDSQQIIKQISGKLSLNYIPQNISQNSLYTAKSPNITYQTLIKGLLQIAPKIEKNTINYSKKIEQDCNFLKISIDAYISEIKNYSKTLEESNNKIGNFSLEGKERNSAEELNNYIKETIFSVDNVTKDFIYNTYRNLQEMSESALDFQKSSQELNNGNAFVIGNLVDSFEKIKFTPEKIAKEKANYQTTLKQDVTNLVNKSEALVNSFNIKQETNNSFVSNIKTVNLGLTKSTSNVLEKNYKFNYPNEFTAPLVRAYYQSLQNLTTAILFPDFNPKGKPIPESLLVSRTNDLRETIKLAEQGDGKAQIRLNEKYGYTVNNAPKAGQMWLAANYVGGDLDNSLVKANHFPATGNNTIDSKPPDVKTLLFGDNSKAKVELKDKDGKTFTINSLAEYQNLIAENRLKAGIPSQEGKPLAVHVSFEGGGGFGKRHAATVSEMYNLGIVPASVSGVSAGSINAGLIAAGLSPSQADIVSKDPQIKKFLEVNPLGGPGLTTGREFYRYMDEKLREITGIKDRPVTFADLKMPLYIGATKIADSQAPNDMTRLEDRIFVFSKETTPDTPVAMAMTASAAVPGSFDPVVFVDVATGRTIRLVDGGMINNLPIGYQKNDLPEIALKLERPNINNPNNNLNRATPKPLPPGNLTAYTALGNTQIGVKLFLDSAEEGRNFQLRNNPPPGVFVLNIPTWNLKNYVEQNNVIEYQYDKKIDTELDKQTYEITNNFFRQFFTDLNEPNKSGTNLKEFPKDTSFLRNFQQGNTLWTAQYEANSEKVTFKSNKGEVHNINLGKERLENWLADDVSFGDLVYRLEDVLVDYQKYTGLFGN
jgi:NTE family protein